MVGVMRVGISSESVWSRAGETAILRGGIDMASWSPGGAFARAVDLAGATW
jgi:hypothetical protein